MNIQQALHQAEQALKTSSSSALLDARVLLAHVLQSNTAHLMAWPEKNLSLLQKSSYLDLIKRRQQGRPVAHLTGYREFWSLDFNVDDSTLIPRPETETLVEYILKTFSSDEQLSLLDMGTGTGVIAISIAKERPQWEITGNDISKQAIELAQANALKNNIDSISFLLSDWFEAVAEQRFDIIVSNPPYIATDDPHLLQGDVRFEPRSALISGKTGMDDIEHLCLHARQYLKINGYLVIEHGYNQKQQVADCFSKNGYTQIEHRDDLSGHTRMTAGKR